VAQVVLDRIFKRFPQRDRGDRQAAQPQPEPQTSSNNTHADQLVLRGIDLTVQDGEFLVLVGASGCGKSTLLRSIAGLEQVTSGTIKIGDRPVNDLPPKARNIAMVFQSYALYPHLTVYDNLAFGLRRTQGWSRDVGDRDTLPTWWQSALMGVTRSLPRPLRFTSERERQIDRRVRQVAQTLQIEALLDRRPKQLSGGQKQRVALGRAMARNPDVFLMDEPLSNLDAKLRTETRAQIVKLQRQLGITTIYVTHDQTEAMTMGDRIAIMNQGQIVQIGQPMELYQHPVNRFVAAFIGSPPMNFLPVLVKSPTTLWHPSFRLTLPSFWETTLQPYREQSLVLGLRPECLSLGAPAPKNLCGVVQAIERLGSDSYVTVDLKLAVTPELETTQAAHPDNLLITNLLAAFAETATPPQLIARLPAEVACTIGDEIWLSLNLSQLHLFDAQTDLAIVPLQPV